ncbi:MAG TPA: phosphocholine cytidylyltransferase family protein [Cyclobacteriaceae bacterium]|nr:phosphocholine cytidylyltransferase family protein [Cyclobacteriaceae bacterium]
MINSIDTAVILAAGLGSRLGDLKEQKPKAFVSVGGETLIHRSLRLLIKNGVNRIIIGTGYQSEFFDSLKTEFSQIETRRNEQYAETGSMYTLFNIRDMVAGSLLLLEGDLLYEENALKLILSDSRHDIILASDATHSGDEVFIQQSSEGNLVSMSKDRSRLRSVDGELVGISKLSLEAFKALCQYADQQYKQNRMEIHYEDAMVGISGEVPLFVKVVKDLAWCEIDDPDHYRRAVEEVYLKIMKRDK